jgi:hypothetical protein
MAAGVSDQILGRSKDLGSQPPEAEEQKMNRLTKYVGVTVLMTGLLLGGMGLTTGDTAQAGQNKLAAEKNERHPHIRRAIHELREARKELKTAAHDFGGHRVEALEAVDVAIKQLELALKADKK